MRVLRGSYRNWAKNESPTACAIGVFDGVHLGHKAIFEALRARADEAEIAVVTFADHPLATLRPESVPPMLSSLDQRIEALDALRVDVAGFLDFAEVRNLSPQDFVSEVIVGVMNARHVAVGKHFRFGHELAGDAELLESLGKRHGFSVETLEIVGGDSPIRSTVIRQALVAGDVVGAATMLGRPFQLRGGVIQGDQRGRELGFPTANLEIGAGRAIPARGVYSAIVKLGDGSTYDAVVNIGVRPTFGESGEVVEVHLLDTKLDLYGLQLSVDFVDRIRPERRFSGVEELIEQIDRDVSTARRQIAEQRQ